MNHEQPDDLTFPAQFWWGTSLSAHQSEGGNENAWSAWERIPGKIKNNEQSGLACDHWNRYEEDFDWLKFLNADTHRFSIEWSRLEPSEGHWDQSAIEHYRKMILALLTREIRPVLCLFHFTIPNWAEAKGGFENQEVSKAFLRFTEKCQQEYGELCLNWMTLNEPSVYALGGYAAGVMPPGVKSLRRSLKIMIELLKLHGECYQILKKRNPRNQIGWAHHMRVFTPRTRFSPFSHVGAWIADRVMNWFWLEAIATGRIRLFVPGLLWHQEEFSPLRGAMDYLGINYYGRDLITIDPFIPEKFHLSVHPDGVLTDVNWEVFPQGLELLLKEVKARGFGKYPILITENGLADSKDRLRSQFIYEHLLQFLQTCRSQGLLAMGYLHWSLIDNFEWANGFEPRFGLIGIDYSTQKRTPRPSANYFSLLGKKRKVLKP